MTVDLQQCVSEYEQIIYANFEYVMNRYFVRKTGWIDTKFSMITGQNYPASDVIRGPNAVYSWIQGRGLESLAEFGRFVQNRNEKKSKQVDRQIRTLLTEVIERLNNIRQKNRGHLFFCMTPDGVPLEINRDNTVQYKQIPDNIAYNFSDLFGAKGMYSAAHYIGRNSLRNDLKTYCRHIVTAILKRQFRSDQQCLDINNPVEYVPGRNSFGPYMIAIGLCELIYRLDKDADFLIFGFDLINHVISHHTNLSGKFDGLQEYDMVEFVDDSNLLYRDNQTVLSDPGHSLEFVGLSLKFLETAEMAEGWTEKIKDVKAHLPKVCIKNFQNGFQEKPGGICKLYDLSSRMPYNTDMPWWSLPETLRAAWRCLDITQDNDDQKRILAIIEKCHFCLNGYYIRPQLHYFAVQTRDANGQVKDVIPAVPDIDPSYHTGLSLMDVIGIIDTKKIFLRKKKNVLFESQKLV